MNVSGGTMRFYIYIRHIYNSKYVHKLNANAIREQKIPTYLVHVSTTAGWWWCLYTVQEPDRNFGSISDLCLAQIWLKLVKDQANNLNNEKHHMNVFIVNFFMSCGAIQSLHALRGW